MSAPGSGSATPAAGPAHAGPVDAGAAPAAPRISHVGALVEDLDATIALLRDLLGWEPWSVYEIAPPRLSRRTFRGAPGSFAMLGAETHVGPVDFALNQRLAGPSIYDEYVARRGHGLHHIACMAAPGGEGPTLHEALAAAGTPVAMSGAIDEAIEFLYFDTEPELGVAIETGSGHAISLEPDRTVGEEPPPGAPAASFDGAALVVEDLDKAVDAFTRVLGWGPWTRGELSTRPGDAALDGAPVAVAGRTARAQVGPLVVELVEPGPGPSPERRALADRGPGLHHISCTLPPGSAERARGALERHGARIATVASSPRGAVWYVEGPFTLKLTVPDAAR